MNLGNKQCGPDSPPLMFAEEGQANQGGFSLAMQMIEIAANSGADGIEYQLALASDLYIDDDSGYEVYKKREFSREQIRELVRYAKSMDLIFQAAIFSPNLVDICVEAGVDVLSVNAMDLNNPIMLSAIAESGLPFWLATLMGTIKEIDWAVEFIKGRSSNPFGILHGQHIMASDHSVGVPPEYTNLDCIAMLRKRYGLVTGFVDHTPTVEIPALAVAKGANIVFKHLAPHANWKGPDWGVCLDPERWRESKDLFVYANKTNGNSKDLSQAEIKDRSLQRRSLFTAADLPEGHKIKEKDMVALRPGGGLDPKILQSLVGKSLTKDLPFQHMIQSDDFC